MPPRSMLDKLAVVADKDQLRAGVVRVGRHHRHELGVEHRGLVHDDDGLRRSSCVRPLLSANSSLWIVRGVAEAVALHVLRDGVGRAPGRSRDSPLPRRLRGSRRW